MNKLSHLTRTSLLLGFFFSLDKVVAFARSIIIARRFQLSAELDAFNVANNLPDLLFALISGGALAMAFIPILTEHITQKGRADAWNLFSRVANLAFIATALVAVIIAAFSNQIVRAEIGIAPGFDVQQQQLVADLMRLNLIATLIFSISGLVMAGLQANQHFLLPAMAPLLYNIGQIFGALVLAPRFGVHGLVYGVILGAVLHLGIQIPGLIKYEFRWAPTLDIRSTGMIEVFRVIAPRLVTMFIIQLMFIARDNLASRLDQVGAVTSLTYGWMLMQVPETLLGTAIATALLPTLAEYAARGDWVIFRQTIEKAVRVLIALTLPIGVIAVIGLRPVVQLAFGFDAAGTSMLVWTTTVYMATLTGYTIQEVMARAFYARKEALVPLAGVAIRFMAYVAIGFVALKAGWGPAGIAAAELSLTLEAIIMLLWLNPRLDQRVTLDGALWRGGLAALLVAGVGLGASALLGFLPGLAAAFVAMAFGTLISIPILLPELRTLLRL